MWYLKYCDRETGEMIEKRCDTLAQAKQAYTRNLPIMAYGAVYEANNEEERELANDLFEASEAELTRRQEEANWLENEEEEGYDW